MPYEKKIAREIRCPFEYGLAIFGGKWKARLICLMANADDLRFGDIAREMGNISDGVLSAALKDLMREGIVGRRSFNEIPPRVEYSLTDKGHRIVPLLRSICQWSQTEGFIDENTLLRPCRACEYRMKQ